MVGRHGCRNIQWCHGGTAWLQEHAVLSWWDSMAAGRCSGGVMVGRHGCRSMQCCHGGKTWLQEHAAGACSDDLSHVMDQEPECVGPTRSGYRLWPFVSSSFYLRIPEFPCGGHFLFTPNQGMLCSTFMTLNCSHPSSCCLRVNLVQVAALIFYPV